ncbi:D-glycerate dehydrogenase [Sphingomonas naphthae]|uniref:D-glycerate dehydrogenase n=1 Tax=Sphingomonas naphthae TaxID=1813468 RepID=A0ABY7TJ48_9SPHN|nr:D-glycerate dehydrogenase [Sphingomonas naphthae]WCT73174.1 D-glycerate dehydrogenase [Sphingomonas naphthae]
MADRPASPRVIVTRRLTPSVEARMAELFDTALNPDDHALSADELIAAVAEADVLVPTVTDAIDARVIEAAGPRLKLIANFGNGVDHIDLKAARAKGIIVTNTPGVLTEDTADMAMALILSVPRRLPEGEALARSGTWTGWSPTSMLGRSLQGKTLGILGMGRIGQAVARRARAFGLAIRYHNRHRLPSVVEAELGAVYRADLDQMLAEVDILSSHCPHTPETHRIIDARRLALLGPEGFLINVARGEIVDEAALAAALAAGTIAGAGLDVFAQAPIVPPALLAQPNALLLPHMASATHEARDATGAKVIANIRVWADGHRPPDQVLEGWV